MSSQGQDAEGPDKTLRNTAAVWAEEVDIMKKMKVFETPGRVPLLETGKRTFQGGTRSIPEVREPARHFGLPIVPPKVGDKRPGAVPRALLHFTL